MKTILLSCLYLISFQTSAQINKGQWMIGGIGEFSYSKSKELKYINFQFAPTGAYFFAQKLAGGLKLNAGIRSYQFSTTRTYYDLGVAPMLRYYFLSPDRYGNIFIELSSAYVWEKIKTDYGGKYSYHYYVTDIKTGPAIFINQNTALEFTLGFSHSSRGPIDSTNTNTLKFGIGFQIHLPKKKE